MNSFHIFLIFIAISHPSSNIYIIFSVCWYPHRQRINSHQFHILHLFLHMNNEMQDNFSEIWELQDSVSLVSRKSVARALTEGDTWGAWAGYTRSEAAASAQECSTCRRPHLCGCPGRGAWGDWDRGFGRGGYGSPGLYESTAGCFALPCNFLPLERNSFRGLGGVVLVCAYSKSNLFKKVIWRLCVHNMHARVKTSI